MEWDAIIVGAGMGGCAVAHTLTKQGYKVLILESGLPQKEWAPQFATNYAEAYIHDQNKAGNTKTTRQDNRTEVYQKSGRGTYKVNGWTPVIGGGEGGGTAVYGSVLFRLWPQDFKTWPFKLDDLLPFYQIAEEHLTPRGTKDPLFSYDRRLWDPEPTSATGQELVAYFKQRGLHPFRSPVGYLAKKNCQWCFGHYCAHHCKQSAQDAFLAPALRTGRLTIHYSTKVIHIESKLGEVQSVMAETPDGPRRYQARFYFLTAGALRTPALLLNSKSDGSPMGLGNRHDLVGRYLMRHLIDLYFIKTPSSAQAQGHLNEVSLSDFCHDPNQPNLGLLSYVPSLMPVTLMAREFAARVHAQSKLPFPKSLLTLFVTKALKFNTQGKVLLTNILEDTPSFGNRITLKLDRKESAIDSLCVEYKIQKSDQEKLRASRHHYLKLLSPLGVYLLKVAEDHSFLAHCCGTCRMHPDSKLGVTNASGQVHDLRNLWIADASLFVTSGSVNPALTVAALALKVANDFIKTQQTV
jgi:choline dehydrogenase-like flavoprotein